MWQIMPPSQCWYEYGCLYGVARGGRVRGATQRKSMLKPTVPIRLPLGGLADPLDSCAVCAVYLPEEAMDLLNRRATNSAELLLHNTVPSAIQPRIDF
jgi:hypothetical protein